MRGIGIDFGTTFTVAAAWHGDEAKIIGGRKTPSLIAFEGSGRYIGESASTRLESNPENTIFGLKTLLGQYKKQNEGWIPFKVVPSENSCRILVTYKDRPESLPPEELSAMLISDITKAACDDLQQDIKCAAISVPVNFTNLQRKALKNACSIAGLQVLGLLNESTAASIAYGYNKVKGKRNIMVVNLGASHLDVTVVTINNNQFRVTWTEGSAFGGRAFTENMVNDFVEKFGKDHGCDFKRLGTNEALAQLRTHCEKTKKALSHKTESQKTIPESVFIPSFISGKNLDFKITREQFEELNKSYIKDAIKVVKKAKRETKEKIQEVVLVGGSTKIPKIREKLVKLFEDDGTSINTDLNAEEAVAQGTAIYAAFKSGDTTAKDLVVEDVASHTVSVEYRTKTGNKHKTLLETNGRIPFKKKIPFEEEAESVRVYEDEQMASFISGPLSMLKVKVDADGIIKASDPWKKSDHDKEMSQHFEGVERCVTLWKDRITLLNALQELAFRVIRLINANGKTPGRRNREKDKAKCEKIRDWAGEQMKVDVQSKKIPRRVAKRGRKLRYLEKAYSPDEKGVELQTRKETKGKKKVQELEKTDRPDETTRVVGTSL